MSDWQKIESAPLDGSAVLGWSPEWRFPQVMQYMTTNDNDLAWFNSEQPFKYIEPTHWQNLPKSPE